MNNLIKICKIHNQRRLKEYLFKELSKYYKKKKLKNHGDYLYGRGNIPVLVVAHLDTVHTKPIKSVWRNYDNSNLITSPEGIGGDDRCGVYIILQLIKRGYRPSVLFTLDEEIGGLGAQVFCQAVKKLDVNFILEFDRRGATDVVAYDDENKELLKAIEKFGFKKSYGSFSDISWICPHYKISGVNLSSGYYNAHTKEEFIDFSEVNTIIKKATKILSDKNLLSKKFEYKEARYGGLYGGHYSGLYNYNYYNDSDYDNYTREEYEESGSCSYCDNEYEYYTNDYGFLCDVCAHELDYIKCPVCSEVLIYEKDRTYGKVCPHCNNYIKPSDYERCKYSIIVDREDEGREI